MLTNCAMVCLVAPGFAAVHAAALRGDTAACAPEVPQGEIRWSVLWKVRASSWIACNTVPARRLERRGGWGSVGCIELLH